MANKREFRAKPHHVGDTVGLRTTIATPPAPEEMSSAACASLTPKPTGGWVACCSSPAIRDGDPPQRSPWIILGNKRTALSFFLVRTSKAAIDRAQLRNSESGKGFQDVAVQSGRRFLNAALYSPRPSNARE